MKKQKVTVKIPDIPGKITISTVKGICYVRYETGRTYHPERQNTTPVRATIGRVADEDGMMYPNENYIIGEVKSNLQQKKAKTLHYCSKISDFSAIKLILP